MPYQNAFHKHSNPLFFLVKGGARDRQNELVRDDHALLLGLWPNIQVVVKILKFTMGKIFYSKS
ncbi:MAG TPA: hypothetical protein VHE59_08760 [Mucilaginibacter sp.]|nr:hypothetical protein [Mucilaginibacter sp.]